MHDARDTIIQCNTQSSMVTDGVSQILFLASDFSLKNAHRALTNQSRITHVWIHSMEASSRPRIKEYVVIRAHVPHLNRTTHSVPLLVFPEGLERSLVPDPNG